MRRYSETLDERGREELRSVLLERANLLEGAIEERFKVRGWFARTLERIDEAARRSPPPDDQPGR